MGEKIIRVVLFYSEFSKESEPCVEIIKKLGMPIILIPLDSKNVREYIKNGTEFKIEGVPILCIETTEGRKFFNGRSKVIQWIEFAANKNRNRNIQHEHTSDPRQTENFYGHQSNYNNDQQPNYNNNQQPNYNNQQPNYNNNQQPNYNNNQQPNYNNNQQPNYNNNSKPSKKRKKKKLKKHIINDEDPQIEFLDDFSPPRPQTQGFSTGKIDLAKKQGEDLKEKARQFMEERNNTLGYKDGY